MPIFMALHSSLRFLDAEYNFLLDISFNRLNHHYEPNGLPFGRARMKVFFCNKHDGSNIRKKWPQLSESSGEGDFLHRTKAPLRQCREAQKSNS